MRSKILLPAAAAVGLFAFMAPSTAQAQTVLTGAELYGQQVQVAADNGDINTLTFQQDGLVRISSTNGQSAIGRWFVQNNQMCISVASGARECWGYQSPFQAQQAVTMISDCGATTRWTALNTNPLQPTQRRAGERG
jgi:hypothetical protein